MCGGLNFLNKVSVPWDLTCDEIIYCMEGTFRLTCDGQSYICNPGDVLYIPKDNHIAYECDEKCVIFYAAYPHDWKQQAGITSVSYTHLTLPTNRECRSRWSPYH